MCGIAGFYSFAPRQSSISRSDIVRMTTALAHRGPNDWGYVLLDPGRQIASPFRSEEDETRLNEGSVGLGNRRLSILDLSERGHLPMAGADGKVWLAFNGEVYNYVELRKILEKKGHRFHSTSDSEVVLKAYLEWGTRCFERFNGMWGLAIYDLRSDQLILSRDRFGKKPLYYYQDASVLIFASELKALLEHPRVPREINPRKVVDYAARHYRLVDNDDECFFKDILQVPKQSFLKIDSNGSTTCQAYWTLRTRESLSATLSQHDLVEQFRDLLRSAVKIRLRSDVPVGCMLSGGMDSTSITCLAVESKTDMTTFSAVTGNGYYDEREFIEAVVDKTGVESKFFYPSAAALFPTLKEMIAFHDEPVCTVSWYSLYLITKQIAACGIPVILTGHGGDELLGGYWDHYHYHFSDIRAAGGNCAAERQAWLKNHGRDPAEYDRERAYIDKLSQNNQVEIDKYSQYLVALSPAILPHARNPVIASPCEGNLSRRLYLELFYETVPPVLKAEDRNTMAHSIEARVPFLDYRLVEFCFSIANEYKIRKGLGKWILREAMKGILPEKVRARKEKVGHNAPADQWFRTENRREIEDLLRRKSFVNEAIYDRQASQRLFQEHLSGINHSMFFWQYINLNIWCELNSL